MKNPRPAVLLLSCFLIALLSDAVSAQSKTEAHALKREADIAARFAPIFYQSLGENKRADYITNFDFDGDWRGDNNWAHTNDEAYPLKAYVYYAVVETGTHYFIHYALFHGRDYKGGERKGAIISELIREGAKRAGKYDPTGIAEESALAHENDMEGCLVVVEKRGTDADGGAVVFLETLKHNTIGKYSVTNSEKQPDKLEVEDGRPLLYVEPKGHGILALNTGKHPAKQEMLIYKFSGHAEDPEKVTGNEIGFELLPIRTTLWPRAKQGMSPTYAEVHDYGEVEIQLKRAGNDDVLARVPLHKIGIAFAGNFGGINMARPPWGWFDRSRREETLGIWFFNPALIIKRDFGLDEKFPTAYLNTPFWAIGEKTKIETARARKR